MNGTSMRDFIIGTGGDHDLDVILRLPFLVYKIAHYVYPKNYNYKTKENDIGLIKLASDVDLGCFGNLFPGKFQ